MAAADTQLDLTAPEEIDALIEQLSAGDLDLTDPAITENLVVDGDTADRILEAADRPDTILRWAGTVTTDWDLNATIEAHLDIFGSGSVGGNLSIYGSGSVGGNLSIYGSGSVGGNLSIGGSVGGDLRIVGSVGGDLGIFGSVAGKSVVTPRKVLVLGSVVGARFGAEVYIGDRVRIDSCDFRQCSDLDKLLLVGTDLFPRPSWRSADRWLGPRLGKPREVTDAEMASVYRRLRTNLEGRSNRPGAAIFYRGEMRSRFWAAAKAGRPEAVLVGLYWLMSGFGLNPWRPVLFFTTLAAVATGGFLADGELGTNDPGLGWWEVFHFSVRSMVSFVSPPSPPGDGNVLELAESWLQFGLRFLGPLLVAQFVLAIRDRVAR